MENRKPDWFMWFGILLLIITIVLLVRVTSQVKSDGGECIKSPFTYGAMKLESATKSSVTGTIVVYKQGTMYFNSSNLIAGETWSQYHP